MKYSFGISTFTKKAPFIYFYPLIIFLFINCSSNQKKENSQENNLPEKEHYPNIISIYSNNNAIDFWEFNSGKYQITKSDQLPQQVFLPLGIQKINRIKEKEISIELPPNKVTSKIKTQALKVSFLDSLIPFSIPKQEATIDLNNYSLIIVPSKPDEYGNFKSCVSCPFNEQELYLKCKLEWESIFGSFKEFSTEEITNAN